MFQEMPFGRHKGTPLPKLPKDYVEWLLSQEWCKGPLRGELEKIQKDRYPKIDSKFHLQPTHKRESLNRQFAAKADAIQQLRESYNATPRAPEPLSKVRPRTLPKRYTTGSGLNKLTWVRP